MPAPDRSAKSRNIVSCGSSRNAVPIDLLIRSADASRLQTHILLEFRQMAFERLHLFVEMLAFDTRSLFAAI